ncbi:MAG: hypothetical protein ACJ715_14085 [Ornithinibacter sp.]
MVVIEAFGARWVLDVSGLDEALARELVHLWDRATGIPASGESLSADACPPFVVTRTAEGWVEVDGSAQPTSDPDVPYRVSRRLTHASILRRSGQCVMLHAAGVATDDGGTVALVAASGTGKTTAGRVLGRRLGYVSDETVAVEHDLTVRAYPKPLSIVVDPASPSVKHERSPDDLRLRRAPRSLRLSAVVVLERSDDAVVPTLEPIGLVEAMGVVLPQTSALPSLDRPLDRLARVLAAGHGPYRLRYRDIDDCVDLVGDLAHAGVRTAPKEQDVVWTWVAGPTPSAPTEPAPEPASVTPPDDIALSTTVWRSDFRDAVVCDGSVLLLSRDGRPITLPGLAATLWLSADAPRTVGDLVGAATARIGSHPDAEALVLATARTLVGHGVLRAG